MHDKQIQNAIISSFTSLWEVEPSVLNEWSHNCKSASQQKGWTENDVHYWWKGAVTLPSWNPNLIQHKLPYFHQYAYGAGKKSKINSKKEHLVNSGFNSQIWPLNKTPSIYRSLISFESFTMDNHPPIKTRMTNSTKRIWNQWQEIDKETCKFSYA